MMSTTFVARPLAGRVVGEGVVVDGRLLSMPAFWLLASCRAFRTLDEHAAAFVRSPRGNQTNEDAVKSVLVDLVANGLLVERAALLRRVADHRRDPPATPISVLGFVTKDRPGSLLRAVASYARGVRRHGRSVEIVIADDSTSRNARLRSALARLARRTDLRLTHIDVAAKRRFAQALVDRGISTRVVEFAMFDPERCGEAIGANRNALLLMRAGAKMLVADDDTIGRTAIVDSREPGLELWPERDPTELWFGRDRAAALGHAKFVDTDLLAEHEALLGRSLGQIVAEAGEHVDIERMCGHFMESFEARQGTVAITLAGVVGDSGMYSPAAILHAQGATRGRMMRSELDYETAVTSREVVRMVRRAAVTHGPPCMSTTIGLDGTELLPPFMPVGRNEDGVFGFTLARCFAHAYIGHVPVAVVHAPPPRGDYAPDRIGAASHVRMGDVAIAAMMTMQAAPSGERASAVREMGRAFSDLASRPLASYEQALRAALRTRADLIASKLEGEVAACRDALPCWTRDVLAHARELRAAAEREEHVVPVDLLARRSMSDARELSRRLVFRLGELMEQWPALVDAARAVARAA